MSTESNVTESDPGIEPAPGGYELLYVYSFGRYHDQFDLPEGSWRPGQLYHDPQAYEGMPDDPTPEEYVDYVTRKDFFGQGNYSDWTDEQLTDGVFMFTGSPDTISPTSIRISDKDYRFEDQDDTGQIMEDPLPLQWSATDDTIIPAGTKIYIAATITVTMYYTREVDGAPRHTSGEDYIVYVLKTEAGQNFGIAADRPFTLPQDAYRDENGVFQGMANLQITSVTPGGVLRIPCFTRGTMIDTPDGPVAVEKLRVGDLVMTRDNGAQPLRWVGGRSLSLLDLLASPNLRPVRIAKGSLGDGLPTADLCVSPQHRVLVRSVIAQRMFGTHEVLIAAKHLIGIDGIRFDRTARGVDYFHLMFDAHQVVVSNGAPSESLYLGPEMLKILGNAARAEILALFPEVTEVDFIFPAARPLSNGRKGRQLVERHARNRQPLFA